MAVAFDASSVCSGSFSTSLSWTHTPVGDPSGVAVDIVYAFNATQPDTVTYGATSLAMEVYNGTGGEPNVTIWGAVTALTGAQTVTITFSTTRAYIIGCAQTFTGSDGTDFFSNNANANGTSTTPSVACTSAAGELVIDCVNWAIPNTITVDGSQTEIFQRTESGSMNGGGSREAGASSVTMSWTVSASSAWRIVAASVKAAGGGGGATGYGRLLGDARNRTVLA